MFWKTLESFQERTAVIDENGKYISYTELGLRVRVAAENLAVLGERRLGFLFISNTLNSLVTYLACLNARHVPLLLPPNMPPSLVHSLQECYQPDWIMGKHVDGILLSGAEIPIFYTGYNQAKEYLHEDLALLLSTSGSTGSPKLVRLSYANLQANAKSIVEYLDINISDITLTLLPSHYSYGLSVINSYLEAGAQLVLRDVSVISQSFIQILRNQSVTSISGVPYIYQLLWRTGFHKQALPSLRTLTQAGGRLDDRLTKFFEQYAGERGLRFFSMYGQTEATARISYVPPGKLAEKIGSIGIAIPEGKLCIDPKNGELCYQGPNVMQGYATCRQDLALGDMQNGLLRTGDLAYQDAEGFFYVNGRLKRFIKLAGNRISLDEVEWQLQDVLGLPVMAGGCDERLVIWIETKDSTYIEAVRQNLALKYFIHHSLCQIKIVENIPLLSSGKKDYLALTADF